MWGVGSTRPPSFVIPPIVARRGNVRRTALRSVADQVRGSAADTGGMDASLAHWAVTTRGQRRLSAIGAAVGASGAVAAIGAFVVFVMNPWLDGIEADATEMFGPAEGWLAIFGLVLVAPPVFCLASWAGLRWARTRWSYERRQGGRAVFFLVLVFGSWISVAIASNVAGVVGLVLVLPLAAGAGGFVAEAASSSPSAEESPSLQPPPPFGS